jgi:hypothetical protein
VGIRLPSLPRTSAPSRSARSRRWLATLTSLASLAAGCGGGQATASPSATPPKTSSTAHANGTTPSPSGSATPTSYCDAQDATIPGAAAFLAGKGAHPTGLTAVQEAWLDMDATMVPACSEIVPNPPPVTMQNLTNGELSSADFQSWMTEDAEWLTLVEWAQQHGQAGFITYLQGGAGNTLTSFVRAGGKVVDSQVCEYPEKADAVSVTAEQMSALTDNISQTAGVVYVIAAVGPWTSTWTTGDGTVTDKGLSSGQEGIEVDVTSTSTNPALGQFLIKNATWDRGDGTVSDGIMQQVGI